MADTKCLFPGNISSCGAIGILWHSHFGIARVPEIFIAGSSIMAVLWRCILSQDGIHWRMKYLVFVSTNMMMRFLPCLEIDIMGPYTSDYFFEAILEIYVLKL